MAHNCSTSELILLYILTTYAYKYINNMDSSEAAKKDEKVTQLHKVIVGCNFYHTASRGALEVKVTKSQRLHTFSSVWLNYL